MSTFVAKTVADAINAGIANPNNAETIAEQAAIALIQGEASALNPLAGVAAGTVAPVVVHGIMSGLFGLFAHLGAEIPTDLHKAKSWLDQATHGIL